jgi:hypothetical protein
MLLLAASLPGTELFSWHVFDTRLVSQGRFELTLHHRTRTRHEIHYLDQSRFGPIARFNVNPRFAMIAGYYYQPQQLRDDFWTKGQRVFLGFETPLVRAKSSVLSLRGMSERHMGTGRPAYTRNRTSLRWTVGTGRVRPFVQNELLAVWPHFHSTRNSGGLSIRLNDEMSMDVSYLYDTRRAFWGGDRQSIVTSMRWNPRFSAPRKR